MQRWERLKRSRDRRQKLYRAYRQPGRFPFDPELIAPARECWNAAKAKERFERYERADLVRLRVEDDPEGEDENGKRVEAVGTIAEYKDRYGN
jgi:hypothetical protein